MSKSESSDERLTNSGISRRGFVRIGLLSTGVATAGIGTNTRLAPVQSGQAVAPIAVYAGVAVGGYLLGRAVEHFSGLGSAEDYEQTQVDSIRLQAYYDGKTIKSANDSVLTAVQNLQANAKSVAYQEGRAAFLEALNAGDTVAIAEEKGITAIENYIAPNQRNVMERKAVMMAQLQQMWERANEIDGISGNSVVKMHGCARSIGINKWASRDISLVDGSTVKDHYAEGKFNSGAVTARSTGFWSNNASRCLAKIEIRAVPDDAEKPAFYVFRKRFKGVFDGLVQAHDDAKAELQTFASGIAEQYQAGDISTEELVTPRDLWEMSSEDTDNPYAAADLAGLGLEVNQDSAVVVRFLDDDSRIEGSVYLSQSPIGESLRVGTVYDPTASRSTDADGNPNDTMADYAGDESDPVPLDGLAFLAYNTDSGSTYAQIEEPFEVINAFGEDGKSIQEVGYQPSTGQQTTTTDVEELRKELQSINDEITELEQKRQELATEPTGGSFSTDGIEAALGNTIYGIPLIGWLIGVTGLGFYFSNN